MKALIKYSLLIALVTFCISCKEEPIVTPPVVIVDEAYGNPFESVPATEDIVMYEINLRHLVQLEIYRE